MEKIIAVIVTYNGMKWVEECLQSIQSSSIPIEILVVDNASSDMTVAFVKKKFTKAVVLEQNQNLGFGKANNIGIDYALKANADYVFLLNQDAKVEENTVEKLIFCFKKNKKYGILSPLHLNWDGNDVEPGFYNQELFADLVLKKNLKNVYIEERFINASCWLLPKQTLNIVGGFDPIFFHYGEDVNYCQRILFHGLKLGIVARTKVYHDTTNTNQIKAQVYENNFMQIERHFKNQTLIKFANVNTNDYLKFNGFRNKMILKLLCSLITFDRKEIWSNYQKFKLLKKLGVKSSVIANKKAGKTHLL